MRPDLARDLERFARALESRFGEALITLAAFGSQVQGTAKPDSDLDILIVIEGLSRRRVERYRLVRPMAHAVSDEFSDTLSMIVLTPHEAATIKPYYLGFLDGHELVVDRDAFFARVLDRLRRRLEELGARRLTDERGNPYWDLKPDYVLGEDVVL